MLILNKMLIIIECIYRKSNLFSKPLFNKKNAILCLVLSPCCIKTIPNRDVKIILYYYKIIKKDFTYSRLKGTVGKTAFLTLNNYREDRK